MDKSREEFVREIERLTKAVDKTKSEYLKRDYGKAIIRMKRELLAYDRYKKQVGKPY